MKIKLIFSPSNLPFNESTQNAVNSCIHRMFGKDNKCHNSFSNYAVSSLFGGVIVDGKMTYPNGAHFYFSSHDDELNEKVMYKAIDGIDMHDMKLISINFEDFKPHSDYDIVRTISPILLKDKDRIITYKDSDFIDVLTKKSKLKLKYDGFTDKEINSLVIEPFHFENARLKFPKVHNIVNKSSQVMLIIKGDKAMRKALYEMGLGNSTGSGFGSIEIIK